MYYGQEPSRPPKWWQELVAITVAVFSVLFWPMVALIGFIIWLVLTILAFTTHWVLGLAALGVLVAAVAAFAYWDSRRPPEMPA